MAKVRLTIRPDEVTEVPDEEVAVLRAQGLLIGDAPDGGVPAPGTAAGPAAAKTTSPAPAGTGKEG